MYSFWHNPRDRFCQAYTSRNSCHTFCSGNDMLHQVFFFKSVNWRSDAFFFASACEIDVLICTGASPIPSPATECDRRCSPEGMAGCQECADATGSQTKVWMAPRYSFCCDTQGWIFQQHVMMDQLSGIVWECVACKSKRRALDTWLTNHQPRWN